MSNENKHEKIYNLKAVVNETGINPETLRAWERRYGLPHPDRSDGGHRRYSLYDVDLIKWLNDCLEEGMSISSAVELYESLEAAGKDPILRPNASLPFSRMNREEGAAAARLPQSLAHLRDEWVAACMAFNEARVEQILSLAFSLHPAEDVCFEVLRAGLEQIGQRWYEGSITIQQEHFATAQAMRKLENLIASSPRAIRHERIIIAAPAGESHEFALLLLSFLFKRRGFEVIYLGANVPNDKLAVTIRQIKPDFIISSAQLIHTAAALSDLASFALQEGVVVGFGGGIFNRIPGLIDRIPGIFLGKSMEEAVFVVEEYLKDRHHIAAQPFVSKESRQTLDHFRLQIPLIEAAVMQKMARLNMPYQHLRAANTQIGRDIMAALALDCLPVLGSEVSWVEGLLVNYGIPLEVLRQYLEAYREAAKEHLDEQGSVVVEWLGDLTHIGAETITGAGSNI